MGPASVLATLICVCSIMSVTEARWGVRLKQTTASAGSESTTASSSTSTTSPSTPVTSTSAKTTTKPSEEAADPAAPEEEVKEELPVKEYDCPYHPADVKKPRLVEQYDQRSVDGLYEYRYVLSNGDTRYERAYWKPVSPRKKVLARRGFYSYPLPNKNFLTVIYTADQNGYHQESAKYSEKQPVLPRSLLVPDDSEPPVQKGKPNKGKKPHLKSNEIGSSEESEESKESADSDEVDVGGDGGQTAEEILAALIPTTTSGNPHHQHQQHHEKPQQHQQEMTGTLPVANTEGEQ